MIKVIILYSLYLFVKLNHFIRHCTWIIVENQSNRPDLTLSNESTKCHGLIFPTFHLVKKDTQPLYSGRRARTNPSGKNYLVSSAFPFLRHQAINSALLLLDKVTIGDPLTGHLLRHKSQIALIKVKNGASQHTVYQYLMRIRLHSHGSSKVPMLTKIKT